MKYYADKFKVYDYKCSLCEYEVLNELKSAHRSDDNCLYHTRFLFESDSLSLDDQIKYAIRYKPEIMRVTFSGKKSVHIIIELPLKFEQFCYNNYKLVWNYFNKVWFDGNCDKACANPSRLTRCPNVLRKDTGKLQTLLYEGGHYVSDDTFIKCIEEVSKILDEQRNRYFLTKRYREYMKTDDKVDCSEWNVVKRYLETPFPLHHGNGNSSSWLYAALQTCKQYDDETTMQKVIDKAMGEGWTQHEIEHKLK